MAESRISGPVSAKIANMGFVCALLVVFIHVERVPQVVGSVEWMAYYFIRYVLAVAAVPFFFLVSGFFLAQSADGPGWWRRAMAKRLRTLGVPYFVWCLVPALAFGLLAPGSELGGICSRVPLRASSIAAAFGFNLFTVPEANRPLWYVRSLFLLMLASPLLVRSLRKAGAWFLLAVLGIYWSVNSWSLDAPTWWLSVRWRMVWTFGFPVEGLFYFCVGLYLGERPLALRRRTGIGLGIAGLLTGLAGMGVRMAGGSDYGYLTLATIPLVLLLLWEVTPSVRWPAGAVGHAFALYVIHPLFIRALGIGGVLPSVPGCFVLEAALAVVLSILSAVLLDRLAPRLASIVFGGRSPSCADRARSHL